MERVWILPCKISGVFQKMKSKIFKMIRNFKSFQVNDTDLEVVYREKRICKILGWLENKEPMKKMKKVRDFEKVMLSVKKTEVLEYIRLKNAH